MSRQRRGRLSSQGTSPASNDQSIDCMLGISCGGQVLATRPHLLGSPGVGRSIVDGDGWSMA